MPDDVLDEIFKTPGTPAPTRRTGSAADSIKRIFDEEGANSSLGLAMARQEGGKWDTRTSGAGAQGPLQVIPATGLRYVKPEEWATPEGKIRASARYIKELSAQFGDDPYYITAAYHAGEGKVKSYYEKGQPIPRAPEFYDKHANIYTPDHVDRVMSNLQGQGKRSIYGNKSVLDDIFSQQPPPPAQDNSGIAVGHQQSQPPAAPPQQTYAPGLGPWPEKDAKGKPYKPLTPEMAAWQAEGRANTDREMALRDVAVGHKQDPFEGVAVGHNQNYVPPPATPATWLETGKATLKEGGARLLRTFGNLAIPSDIPYDRMTPAEKLVRDKQRDYGQESQAVYQRSSLPQKITQKVGSGVIGAVPPVVATMAGVPAPLAFGANTTAENLDLGAERAVTEGLKAGLTVGLMQKAQPLITPLSEGIKASIASRLVAGGLVGTGAAAMQVVDDVFSTGQPDYERAAHYGIPAAIITALLPGAGGQVRMGEYVGNVNDGAPPSTAMTRSNVVEEGYQGAPGAPLRRNNALPPGIRPQGVSPFEPPLAEPPSPRPPVAPSPGSPSGPRLLPPGGGAPRPAMEPTAPAAELPSNPLWAGDEVGINGTTVKITSADSMVVRGIDTASGQPRFWPKQVFEKMAGRPVATTTEVNISQPAAQGGSDLSVPAAPKPMDVVTERMQQAQNVGMPEQVTPAAPIARVNSEVNPEIPPNSVNLRNNIPRNSQTDAQPPSDQPNATSLLPPVGRVGARPPASSVPPAAPSAPPVKPQIIPPFAPSSNTAPQQENKPYVTKAKLPENRGIQEGKNAQPTTPAPVSAAPPLDAKDNQNAPAPTIHDILHPTAEQPAISPAPAQRGEEKRGEAAGAVPNKEPWEMTASEMIAAARQKNDAKIAESKDALAAISSEAKASPIISSSPTNRRDNSSVNQAAKFASKHQNNDAFHRGQINKYQERNRLFETEEGKQSAISFHREQVIKAISEGRSVPSKVLADYPDLQPKVAPQSQQDKIIQNNVPASTAPSSAKESDLIDAGWTKKDLATYTHADGRTLRREGGRWVLSGEKMRGGKLRKPKKYATLKDAIADLAPSAKPAQATPQAESPIQPAKTMAPATSQMERPSTAPRPEAIKESWDITPSEWNALPVGEAAELLTARARVDKHYPTFIKSVDQEKLGKAFEFQRAESKQRANASKAEKSKATKERHAEMRSQEDEKRTQMANSEEGRRLLKALDGQDSLTKRLGYAAQLGVNSTASLPSQEELNANAKEADTARGYYEQSLRQPDTPNPHEASLPEFGKDKMKMAMESRRSFDLNPWRVDWIDKKPARAIVGAKLVDSSDRSDQRSLYLFGTRPGATPDNVHGEFNIYFDRNDIERSQRARQIVWAIGNAKAESVHYDDIKKFIDTGEWLSTPAVQPEAPKEAPKEIPKEAAPAKAVPSSLIAKHVDLFERVEKGEATAAEFKAAFDELLANKEAIKAELSALTKDAIFDKFPGLRWRYKSDKKDRIVSAAYDDMLGDFSLGGSISYVMGQGSYEQSVRNLVAKVTDESLAEYAEKIKKARAERDESRKAALEGMKDPQTLEDYTRLLKSKMAEGASYQDARTSLTPEQRSKFDELAGAKSRDERRARADQQRTEVRAASQATTGQVIETKHTKTGEPLFVVKAADRVERDVYNQWNATAKRLGGWYSSFRGAGAVPGFQFKTRDAAEAFLEYLGGKVERAQETAQARRDAMQDDKSQTAVERLREMADSLDEHADEVLSAERQANTERRARFAANAEAVANSDKAMAATMRNIAEAIESGKAKFLDRVRQKVQVEMLQTFVRAGYDDYLRAKYPTYAEQEKHRAASPPIEAADYVQFPAYTAFRSDLAKLGRQLSENDGTKKLGVSILKVADDVTDAYLKFAKENLHKVSTFARKDGSRASFPSKGYAETAIARSGYKGQAIVLPFKRGENIIILSSSAAREKGIWEGDNDARITLSPEIGDELVEKLKRQRRREFDIPWIFETASERRKRLTAMGIETPAELRAAVREFIGLRKAPKAPDKIKEMERAMVGRRNDGLDFFPTPAGVADEMIATADIQEGMSVLEPSAGMGHIADRLREAGFQLDVMEFSSDRRDLLKAKGYYVVGSDFMDLTPRGFTYGDVFKYKDGRTGIMRGSGGMGSSRVGFIPEGKDDRQREWVDREDLTGVRKVGHNSGYDRILMNPPFSDRRDVEHVRHAYDLLKPGGRVVAIMGEGSFFGSDKKATAFREWLESVGGTSEKLEEGTFLDPSLPVNTGVNARMVVIDKPEGKTGAQPEVEASAPPEERKAAPAPAPEVIKPTPTEQRTVAKAASNEKIDPNTGFTKSQGEYVASTLKEELPKLQDGQPITVEVPGDGKFTARTPEGANNLYYKLTGKPLISGQRPTVARPVAGGRSDGARKVESMMRSSSERSSGLPADVGEDARGVFPIEMASTTGGWAGNISPTPEFVTDGHAMILASAIGKKSTLLSKTVDDGDEAGKARRTPARIQETWNNAVKAAQKTGTIEGAFMTGTHAGIYAVVTAPRMDAPLVASAAKFKTILDSTEADEVRVKDAASPVVFYKGGQPVAILMPFKLDEKTVVPLNAMRAAVSGKTLKGQEPEFALRQDAAPVFFSQLERTIEEKMPAKASARQVRAIIQSPQNGVKPDEVKWSGLDDYLNTVESLTKEDVLKWLRANRVDVQEVEKGRPELSRKRRDEMQVEANIAHARGDYERSRQIYSQINKLTPQETKFSEYVLPGAKSDSYRELLLTMPQKMKASGEYTVARSNRNNGWAVFNEDGMEVSGGVLTRREAENRRADFAADGRMIPDGPTFRSQHFDEPNILAHIRFNERTDSGGKRVLHIEEIQSDWHQDGRKKGYKADNESGVPDAPFKKTWHELAFKRMLRYAAENGYDKLTWTTGEQQGERYSEDNGGPKDQARTQGMRGFYDQILPAFASKYAKKWGAKVESAELGRSLNVIKSNIGDGYEVFENGKPAILELFQTRQEAQEAARKLGQGQSVHSISITPAMRESVMQGQPQFAKTTAPKGWEEAGGLVQPERVAHRWNVAPINEQTATMDELLDGMRSRIVPPTRSRHLPVLHGNGATTNILEKIGQALGWSVQSFAGVNLAPDAVDAIVERLTTVAFNVGGSKGANLMELAGRFRLTQEQAKKAGYNTIQYIDADDTLPNSFVQRIEQHEIVHAEQHKIGQGNSQLVSDEWVQKDRDFKQLSRALKNYGGTPRKVAVEAIAFIASGDHERMGYTGNDGKQRAIDFAWRYFQEVAHQHGAWAIKQFRYIRPEYRKAIKEVAKQYEQSGRGRDQISERGNGRESGLGGSTQTTAPTQPGNGPAINRTLFQGERGHSETGRRGATVSGESRGRLFEGRIGSDAGSDHGALAIRQETLPDFSQRDFWGVGEAKSAVETFGKWSRESLRDVRSVVNPMGRGLSGEQTASITRERAAEMARKGDQADEKLKDARKILGKLPEMNRRAFVYAIETGTTDQLPAQFQPFAATTRELLDGRRDEVQSLGTGKLQSFYENYFPHIWKDPEKANQVFMSYFAKRPFEGSKSFLKQRTVPTTEHGIALGLKPVSTNPVDLVMLKLREMDRYIMAHRIMDEMKDKGLLSRIKATHRVPPGYAKLDDKVSTIYGAPTEKGTIKIRGYWIAPEAAANVVNNYLSPGLRKFALFRGYLWLANVMNQFQLGISFFHFGFTSLDAAISKAALAMQQLAYGRPLQAAKSAVQVPVAPITTILKGRKMYKAWMDPGSMGPEWDEIAAAGQAGGARVRQDQLYATQMTKKMVEAFRKKNLPGVAGGLFRMPFAAIEQIARPLMEYLVPRQKLGVFAELARLELERLGPNATREDVRKTMAKVWDSVDNRMGQLVYDNLFWDKTFKDVLMASVRSVGWNLGTKREVIGGVSDFVKFGTNVLARIGGRGGGKIPPGGTPPTSYKSGGDWFSGKPEFTYRMGYVIAMPIVVGLVGAMLNYLLTGERPKGLEDCYFPRTGSFDENGKPNRISLPSYMKDIYHYMVDPKKTVVNKLHPALNTVAETLSNKDFYGTEVYNPDDPPYEVAKDVLKHIGASFEPFAIRGLREDKARQTGAPDWFPFIGLTPAPKSLNQSKAERLMDELNAEHRPMGSRTKEQAAQGRLKADIVRTVRRGGEEEGRKMAQDAIDAGKLSGAQLPQIERRAHTPGIVWSFTSLSLSDSLKVWDVATEEEKQALRPALQKKMQSLGRMPEEERNRLLPKARAALGNAP